MKLFGSENTLHKYSRCEIIKHDSGLQEILIFFFKFNMLFLLFQEILLNSMLCFIPQGF